MSPPRTQSGTKIRMDTGTNISTGSGTGIDADSGASTGAGSGTGASIDSGTNTGVDAGIDTVADSAFSALDVGHMQAALAQAELARSQGEVPVGAVVVDENGLCVAAGFNRTLSGHDPTG